MSVTIRQPATSVAWYGLSKTLTDFVNKYNLGPEPNLIVYCFDHTEDNWEDLPAAWHRPDTGDIVINMGVVFREMGAVFDTPAWKEDGAVEKVYSDVDEKYFYVPRKEPLSEVIANTSKLFEEALESYTKTYNAYQPHVDQYPRLQSLFNFYPSGTIRPLMRVTDSARALLLNILGVILHETGHSVFSTYILDKWWKKIDWYDNQILTMLDELRCEYRQVKRLGKSSLRVLRYAANLVINPAQSAADLEKSRDDDGRLEVSSIALSSILVLGRKIYGVFTDDEIMSYQNLIETLVGEDRFVAMFEIWNDYLLIDKMKVDDALSITERWKELFPQPKFESSIALIFGSSGKIEVDSIDDPEWGVPNDITLPGIVDELADAIGEANEMAHSNPDVDPKPGTRAPVSVSWARAVKKPALTFADPVDADYKTAQRLSHTLQTIYLTGRDKFEVRSDLPPGKLNSRAAVQNAANRSLGIPSRSAQWKKNKVVTSINPSLSVGIMTDCSASQNWAMEFSSRMSWILSRAFRSVNAKTASVAFGQHVYITSYPNESIAQRRVVNANQKMERFDTGCGTLVRLLNLASPNNGVRLLFVLTDGGFVISGEMDRAHAWLEDFRDANCTVVWICPQGQEYRVPKKLGAVVVPVNRTEVTKNPAPVIDKLIEVVSERLATEKSHSARH
ncbi:hypothetical protein SEA_BLUENGOLD_116 [Gordonia phage BlueNGold]|nr:hypothetical protein SEA_BLUENGOLD_116 [Gordonia phage BlueNGold]